MKHTAYRIRVALTALVLAAAVGVVSATAQMSPAAPVSGTVPAFNGIAHIAIRVQYIAASVAFYNKLGYLQAFAMNKDGVVTQSFIKINDKQFIELYPVGGANPQAGFLHLCFEGVDLNAIHDKYVADGLTPNVVRKAGAGNLLFTMKGPQQFAEPQNIEYTQYQPGSLHTNDVGMHLGPDRVADRMTVVTLAVQDPAAARAFYLEKLGFTPAAGSFTLLDLPGSSGEQVEIAPLDRLGPKSSIVLETGNLKRAEEHLQKEGRRRGEEQGDPGGSGPEEQADEGRTGAGYFDGDRSGREFDSYCFGAALALVPYSLLL